MTEYAYLARKTAKQSLGGCLSSCCGDNYEIVDVDGAPPHDIVRMQMALFLSERSAAAAQRDTLGALGYLLALFTGIVVLVISTVANHSGVSFNALLAVSIVSGVGSAVAAALGVLAQYRGSRATHVDSFLTQMQQSNAADTFIPPMAAVFQWPAGAGASVNAAKEATLKTMGKQVENYRDKKLARTLIGPAVEIGKTDLAVALHRYAASPDTYDAADDVPEATVDDSADASVVNINVDNIDNVTPIRSSRFKSTRVNVPNEAQKCLNALSEELGKLRGQTAPA